MVLRGADARLRRHRLEGGKLTPFWRYFRERHDFVSLWLGDHEFITFRMRRVHFMTDICCTMSLSMGLVDLQSGSVEGDFWLYQVWVFGRCSCIRSCWASHCVCRRWGRRSERCTRRESPPRGGSSATTS